MSSADPGSHLIPGESGGPVVKQRKNKRKQVIEALEIEKMYAHENLTAPESYNNHPNTVKTLFPMGYKEADNDNNCARRIGIVV